MRAGLLRTAANRFGATIRLRPIAFVGAAALLVSPSAASAQEPPPPHARFAPDAFLDPVAREIYTIAYDGWDELGESVERYAARIDQRISAGVRALGRERILYHSESAVRAFWQRGRRSVVQVLGSRARYPGRDFALLRDEQAVMHMPGSGEEREITVQMGHLSRLEELPFDEPFEPGSDQLFIGANRHEEPFQPTDDDFWLAHPLGEGADTLYRFQSGDTTSLEFPDGRRLDAVQLDVLPRRADAKLITGTLWIDLATGALVRGVYKLARPIEAARDIPEFREEVVETRPPFVPGFLTSVFFEIKMIAADYSMWDFKVWMPRTIRVEGEVRLFGMLKVPVAFDVAYRIESVTMTDDLEAEAQPETPGVPPLTEVHFDTREEAMAFISQLLSEDGARTYLPVAVTAHDVRPLDGELGRRSGLPDPGTRRGRQFDYWIAPEDLRDLETSPDLPPPIWDYAPGFLSDDVLLEYIESLASLPAAPVVDRFWNFDWGWSRTDLVRYNRIEGPAVGGRATWPVHGSYALGASGFFGFADLRPKVRLQLERSTVLRRLALGGYHELRPTDSESAYLGIGNSVDAFLFGRDNGEYYRATGADLTWRPPEIDLQSFHVRVYGELQEPVEPNTNFALFRAFDRGWDFRRNVAADKVEEVGGELRLSPWWGHGPAGARLGIELFARGATWRRAGGDVRENYGQASATVRAIVPVAGDGWQRWRIGIEAAGGNTWGRAPVQRSWFLGGASSLRGFPASTVSGLSFLRGRAEVGRTHEGFAGSLFGDAGWAGSVGGFDADDVLYGIGVGGSIMDGFIRLDLSHGLKGPGKQFRVELYLDAIL